MGTIALPSYYRDERMLPDSKWRHLRAAIQMGIMVNFDSKMTRNLNKYYHASCCQQRPAHFVIHAIKRKYNNPWNKNKQIQAHTNKYLQDTVLT